MMTMITIDKNIEAALKRIANQKAISLDDAASEALLSYIQRHSRKKKPYSFIGIGRSGQENLSERAEEILIKNVNRSEGWSLSD